MVTSFDISQEIFSIDMLAALKSSLKHRRKHVLRSFRLYGDQALKLFIYRSQTFLVTYKNMRSSQLCEDQGIPGKNLPPKRFF